MNWGQGGVSASTIRYPGGEHTEAAIGHYRVPDDEIHQTDEATMYFISCVSA